MTKEFNNFLQIELNKTKRKYKITLVVCIILFIFSAIFFLGFIEEQNRHISEVNNKIQECNQRIDSVVSDCNQKLQQANEGNLLLTATKFFLSLI